VLETDYECVSIATNYVSVACFWQLRTSVENFQVAVIGEEPVAQTGVQTPSACRALLMSGNRLLGRSILPKQVRARREGPHKLVFASQRPEQILLRWFHLVGVHDEYPVGSQSPLRRVPAANAADWPKVLGLSS
jgi:hypothetical protein